MSAGDIFESVGYYEKAIDAYVGCGEWNRAFNCAN